MTRPESDGSTRFADAALLHWSGTALAPFDACAVGPERIVAVDSWLVAEGAVLGIELHRLRFEAAVRSAGAEPDDAFWAAMLAALPAEGEWFPRVELVRTSAGHRLQLRLRPAPERAETVALAVWPGPDPRSAPGVKGPDLDALRRVQTWAQQQQAGEAVLLSPAGSPLEGTVAEGTANALLWWRDGRLGMVPDTGEAAPPRVASVTERTLRTIAAVLQVPVVGEALRPAELAGAEVWAVNALHGIRVAESLIDADSSPVPLGTEPGRAAFWRGRLAALRRPLRPASPAA